MSSPGQPPTPRVVTVSDPAAEALAYARRLGADVARDQESVEAAIAARMDAARMAAVGADDESLLARAAEIRAAAGAGPVGEQELARLRQLAAELAKAERIRAHTERRVAELGLVPAPTPPPEPIVDEQLQSLAAELVAAESARDTTAAALESAERAVTEAEARHEAAKHALEAASDRPWR